MPFAIGERVGDYEVVKVLGAGGMGEVYKVRHVISDRVEAMKVLLPNLEGDAELADRFLREIKVQGSLSHANIASLYTAVKHGNKLLMLMEFVEGSSIEEKLRGGPLAPELGIRYIAQVLDALAYAHSKGVVHRDIKPANIMVTPDGTVKLMDFGIARMKQDRKLTSTGQTVGSLFYMSPEQIRGEELDARSDLYSLGVTLYETVTGKRPFEGTSDYSIMAAHLQQTPVPPIQVDGRVPQRLNEIILTSIAKEREKRFQKAEAFGAALRNTLAELQRGPAVVAPVAAAPVAAPGPAWGRYAAIAAGVLFVGLAASQIPKLRTVAAPVVNAPLERVAEVPVPAAKVEVEAPGSAPTPVTAAAPLAGSAQKTMPAAPRMETQPVPAPAAPVTADPASKPVPAMVKQNLPEVASGPGGDESPRKLKLAPQEAVDLKPVSGAVAAVESPELDSLTRRMKQLGARVEAVEAAAQSLARQQAAQGVGLRNDVKSGARQAAALMDEAARRLQSRETAGVKADLDKAEYVVEKLEKILGL